MIFIVLWNNTSVHYSLRIKQNVEIHRPSEYNRNPTDSFPYNPADTEVYRPINTHTDVAEHIGGSYDIISHKCFIKDQIWKQPHSHNAAWNDQKGSQTWIVRVGVNLTLFSVSKQTNGRSWSQTSSAPSSLFYHQLNTIEIAHIVFSFCRNVSKYSVNQYSYNPTKVLFSETRLSKNVDYLDTTLRPPKRILSWHVCRYNDDFYAAKKHT